MRKRAFDLIVAGLALALLALPLVLVAAAIRLTSPGPALYWSERIGRGNRPFMMPKLRSMRINTPALPTHLLADGESYLTPIGGFLRASSIDELPQLWCILNGEMSIVGPRPALFNQDDLVALRTEKGVHMLRPGLTGWAQVNGRDDLSIPEKVVLDREYLDRMSLAFDLRVIWITACKVIAGAGVSH
jgi:O-antigen biosynthesis protein WbqP